MKFERQVRRVIYLKDEEFYRVTYDSLRKEHRVPRDYRRHLVGVAAAVSYWDTVMKRSSCLACARTIRSAFEAGDRYLLDTDEARRAAELVSDLAQTQPDENDICSALAELLNAIAVVRLNNTRMEDFDVLPAVKTALETCFALPEYATWGDFSRRRRFFYELPRKCRTEVVYTLASLYFNQGSCPILTSKQRQRLLALPKGEGLEGMLTYFDDCLREITAIRFS